MPKVSFKTRSGKKVDFTTSPKRRTRKLSAYNRFAAKELKKQYKKGKNPHTAMCAVSKKWATKRK
jgi:hypothetical protein